MLAHGLPFSPSFLRFFLFPRASSQASPESAGWRFLQQSPALGRDPTRDRVFSLLSCSWSRFLAWTRHAFKPRGESSPVTCPGECQAPPLQSLAPWTLFYGTGLFSRCRFHPSTRDRSNSNAEFIEVVKQSVDNMDGVFLINTAIPRETANCGEVSKTQQRFPRLGELRLDITGLADVALKELAKGLEASRLTENGGLYTNQSSLSSSPPLSLSFFS